MLLIQVLLIQVSTIIIFDNLYVQNQSTTTAQALARTKTRMTTWLNSNFRGRWKEVSGPNVTLASNQWMIVMRIGKQGGNYDYHYWYALPDHPIEVNTFKGERFNQKELEQQLRRCNSFAQMMARSELDSGVKRPLLPLSISQIGLIGGSGMINGLIACDTPHIIKGRIVKVIRTESEEKFSVQGNHIGSEVKETITNKMIFNVLTPNGFKALT